jgi:transposase
MRALDPEVMDAVFEALRDRLPRPLDGHPPGCHRPRVSDELCFRGVLIRLVTGCSWVDAETLLGGVVSDTTLRARRDEWVTAGVFDDLVAEALTAYDRIIGLDFSNVALDASQHKAPRGGDGTGPSYTDKGRSGWKWSIAADADGIPIGWVTAAANRNDFALLAPTLDDIAARGLLSEIGTLHLDRGYDYPVTRTVCASFGITDTDIAARRPTRWNNGRRYKTRVTIGLRWPIERTNSWLVNFGQLRRNTDRHPRHRHAQLALAIALLLTAKLIDWRDRWSPIR